MYWADLPTGTIRSAAMAVEPVVSELIVKQASPLGVAVDPVHGRLYWMNIDLKGAKGEANLISSAQLDGSEAQPLIERGGGKGAPVGAFEGGLAVDPEAGKLYWGEATAQRIATSNLDGSEARTLFSTAPDTPEALALDASSPHPAASSPPVIEGSPQVGAPLQCNPGEWSGTGPISLSYQWQLSGLGTLDGSSWFVAPTEAAGEQLSCIVTARDSVDEGVASSAPVSLNALLAESPSAQTAPRLLGGIALAHLTSSGTSARVPVFSTLAASATLTATRVRRAGARGRSQPAAHARARARGARASAGARGRGRYFPRTESAARALSPGRSGIVLHRLLPGARYALTLSLRSADGQTQRASAVLEMAARRR
jgi:Low-density lipoprotein receptor repeat class B